MHTKPRDRVKESNGKLEFLEHLNALAGIGSFFIALIPAVVGYFCKLNCLYLFAVIVFVVMVAFTLIIKSNSDHFLKFIFNLSCPVTDYKTLEKQVIYEFDSREKIKHEKHFVIQVLKNGIHGVEDKYDWTGESNLELCPVYPNQEITLLDNRYGMQRYSITLRNQRRLDKSDSGIDFGMKMPSIDDTNHISSSHLSSGIYEVTEKIVLRAIFPKNLKVDSIKFLEYLHYTDDIHYRSYPVTSEINEDGKRVYTFEVNHPFMGGRYVIDWNFSDDE